MWKLSVNKDSKIPIKTVDRASKRFSVTRSYFNFNMARITFFLYSSIVFTCLYVKSISACGKNEQLGNCGRICEGTCSNPDLARCAAMSCSGNGCQCKVGYLRNEDTDQCIPAAMCPPKTCKGNEVLAKCGRPCEATCESPRTPEACSRIKCGNEDCICDLDSGYVRNTKTGKCVAVRDCRI